MRKFLPPGTLLLLLSLFVLGVITLGSGLSETRIQLPPGPPGTPFGSCTQAEIGTLAMNPGLTGVVRPIYCNGLQWVLLALEGGTLSLSPLDH